MKQLKFPILTAIAALVISCTSDDITNVNGEQTSTTENDVVSISKSVVTIDKSGGTATVDVTSLADWTTENSTSWLTITPTSGSASSNAATITITAAENTESSARSATITISATGNGENPSLTITVSQAGEGGSTTIETTDTEDSNDNIANTTFDRTINIAYSTSGAATVTNATSDFDVVISGNDVTITNNGSEAVIYNLSGTTTDGFFKLYSSKKQAIQLSGVSITNKNGAAINNQSKKRTFIVVSGTNSLADGGSYSDTPTSEDEKATLFSEGQLIFSGSGSLTVSASGKSGIVSDDYVRFMSSPTIKVTSSAGHAVKGKDAIIVSAGTIEAATSANMKKGFTSDSLIQFDGGATTIKVTGGAAYDSDDNSYSGTAGVKADQLFIMNDGTLTITNSGNGGKGISGDAVGYFNGGTISVTTTGSNYTQGDISAKGIKFDGNLTFAGSNVSVDCSAHEAIESKGTIDVSGGSVYAYSGADDAINAASHFTISGGYVGGVSFKNDGLDANGNLYIKGGVVYAVSASSPEVAIDANTEGGYKLYIQGGTIIAIGGLENNPQLSQAVATSSSWSKSTNYALYNGSSLLMTFKTPSGGGTSLVMSSADMTNGSSYTLKSGVTISGGTSYLNGYYIENATVTGGTESTISASTTYSGGGMGGGGNNPGGGPSGFGGGFR